MRPYPVGNGTLTPRVPREFVALMDALQLEGANTDALLLLDTDDWRKLLEFCDLAHLTLALAQVDRAGFPQWVIDRLEKNLADNAQRFELVRAAYTEAAAVLTGAGVSHMVVKGFSQAPAYVADPRLRVQSDIDFYCPPDQIQRAQTALKKIGYAEEDEVDYSRADHLPTLSRRGKWQWRGNPYDPEMPLSIELHFCLWNDATSLIDLPDVNRFWDRRVERRLGKLEFPGLSDVDQLAYLALHILRGAFTGDWIVHHVHELATFLHANVTNVEFWDEWLSTHNVRLRKLQSIAFSLARSWFSCACSQVVCAEIDRLPEMQKRWLRLFGGSPLEVMFRRNKDGRLLHLLLADTQDGRRAAFRRAIIPPRVRGPNAPEIEIRNRRNIGISGMNRYVSYLRYLVSRVIEHAFANTAFLVHASMLWFAGRSLGSKFWLFVCGFFFSILAYPHITFSSIFF